MIINKIFFLTAVIFCTYSISVAQDDSPKNRIVMESNYHYGFLMPHSDYMSYFVQKHVQSFQFQLGLRTDGKKDWHYSYNFPILGLGYVYSGLGNNNVYGNMHALYLYTDRLLFQTIQFVLIWEIEFLLVQLWFRNISI
ncbi:MAG: hypothetical protein HC831_24115 [Chloroflexia bacterium]|nr:hypothetical protein [Chloroflexia bacterium]